MRHHKRIEYLAIGDELLLGLRLNAHLAFLGEQLAMAGLRIDQATEIPDEAEAIQQAFSAAWKRSDLIITTGGLGPTCDDVTKEVIATTLGRELEHNAEVEADLRQFFQRRGRTPTDNNFRQCGLIRGACALRNPNGTAPGQWLELDGRILAMLPGPASEMRPMFTAQVMPRLRDIGWAMVDAHFLQFRTMGIGESQLADWLDPIFKAYEDRILPAYCAHSGIVDVRLHPQHDDVGPETLKALASQCQQRIGEAFLGPGQPDPACLVLKQLRNLGKSLAVAESCTGGQLADRFTDVPGASKVFMGGVVCYRNCIKEALLDIPGCLLEQHGAVSPECAAAMATSVADLMEADYGLSITGYAGPEGGHEPPGTVYIGFHSSAGVWSRKEVFSGDRKQIKTRSVNAALNLLREQLLRQQMVESATLA